MKTEGLLIAGLALAILLALGACQKPEREGLSVGDLAPPFTLPSAQGDAVALSDFLGKTSVLLYFNMAYG